MLCATLTNVYTCTNSTGTTCTKSIRQQIPVVNANTTCGSTDYVLLIQADYANITQGATAGQASTAQILSIQNDLMSINSQISSIQNFFGTAATPENYAAITAIFAATVTALAIVWGFKRIVKLFSTVPEH